MFICSDVYKRQRRTNDWNGNGGSKYFVSLNSLIVYTVIFRLFLPKFPVPIIWLRKISCSSSDQYLLRNAVSKFSYLSHSFLCISAHISALPLKHFKIFISFTSQLLPLNLLNSRTPVSYTHLYSSHHSALLDRPITT